MKNAGSLWGISLVAGLLLGCAPEMASPTERDSYKPSIEILDVRVGRTMTGRHNVYGQVKNNGSRTLSAVVLHVHYLDEDDQSIGIKQHTISGSIDPNSSTEFRVSADDAAEAWARRARVEVGELAFLSP